MTLCGVLKDIMLVCASIVFYRDPVTPLQFFGYSIALGGMVYYKLGADSLKGYFFEASRRWGEFGATKPVQRKIITFGSVFFLILILLTGVAPRLGYDTNGAVSSIINKGTGK
jgi:hypothetical protein